LSGERVPSSYIVNVLPMWFSRTI